MCRGVRRRRRRRINGIHYYTRSAVTGAPVELLYYFRALCARVNPPAAVTANPLLIAVGTRRTASSFPVAIHGSGCNWNRQQYSLIIIIILLVVYTKRRLYSYTQYCSWSRIMYNCYNRVLLVLLDRFSFLSKTPRVRYERH